MRPLSLAALVAALSFASGCQKPKPLAPIVFKSGDDVFRAGVARADITPPPGLSLFGHGPEGRVATGTLLRLRCEAFVLSRGDEIAVLVPCEIGAPSIELQRAIAARLRDNEVPIRARNIFLMATHTHAGPAHYFGARQYAAGFSSREPGFDPDVLDFLARRIEGAIRRAFQARVPARAAWVFDWGTKDLSRNRSLTAFLKNEANTAPRGCPGTWRGTDSEARQVVDQQLALLRLHRASDNSPLGIFAVFGVHNTAIANSNELYHGDVFGFAVREVEERIARAECKKKLKHDCSAVEWHEMYPEPPVLVGMANGIEGDVSPAIDYQGAHEAWRLGRRLADEVCNGFASSPDCRKPDEGKGVKIANYQCKRLPSDLPEPSADIVLSRIYRELLLPGKPASADSPPKRLCPDPALGVAAGGGADDGPTRLRFFPALNAGVRRPRQEGSCHGWKLPITSPLSEGFGSDGLDFPAVVPFGLLRIGDAVLATAPAELTTAVGRRIRMDVEEHLRGAVPPGNVAIVGLTNSWVQYVTTPEEYAVQSYEGASTLYGPNSESFFRMHFSCLADLLAQGGSKGARKEIPSHCQRDQPIPLDDDTLEIPISPTVVSRMPPDDEPKESWIPHDLEVTSWRGTIQRYEDPLDCSRRVVVETPETPGAREGAVVSEYPAATTSQPWWRVSFRGMPSSFVRVSERLRVRIVDGEGRPIDDDHGRAFEASYDDANDGTWTFTWRPGFALPRPGWQERPCPAWCGDKPLRFEIVGARRLLSKPFYVDTGCKTK